MIRNFFIYKKNSQNENGGQNETEIDLQYR
jgi:hypothetical protein